LHWDIACGATAEGEQTTETEEIAGDTAEEEVLPPPQPVRTISVAQARKRN
jgi:hypothetical protein